MTAIQWTDATWNPVVGCSLVSPGCTHCYAMRQAHALVERFASAKYRGLTRRVNGAPVWTGRVRLDKPALAWPLEWRKPRRVFVNSMSDLFHEALADEDIDKVFAVMALAPQHQFQVLTKRPGRMRAYFADLGARAKAIWLARDRIDLDARGAVALPLANVWLGVSVEDQARADLRLPLLLKTPAAVRFVSAEPLLAPVDLLRWLAPVYEAAAARRVTASPGIDWVIVGGESGPGARPFDLDWARAIVAPARGAGVPVFVKQLGTRAVEAGRALHLRERKGGAMDEWPADLRVREYPR